MTIDPLPVYKGDVFGLISKLYLNGAVWDVTGATITACFRDANANVIAGPWTCLSGATGASWSTGDVIVPVSGTSTAEPQGGLELEVQVILGGTTLTKSGGNITLLEDAL